MDVVDGHTDRLIPVTQIDLHDIEWSLAEMERMREAGSRAFVIPEAPVGGRGGRRTAAARSAGRSATPTSNRSGDAAEDLGMAAFAHVGFARERINAGWANNGADDLLTFNALNMLAGSQIGPQLLLGSLILDGVLERHPGLVVVAEEVGIDWLPHLVTTLEVMVGRTPEVLHDGEYRPGNLERGGYRLPLTPTEYLQRQVRASPAAGIAADRRGSPTGPPGPALLLQRLPARGGHEPTRWRSANASSRTWMRVRASRSSPAPATSSACEPVGHAASRRRSRARHARVADAGAPARRRHRRRNQRVARSTRRRSDRARSAPTCATRWPTTATPGPASIVCKFSSRDPQSASTGVQTLTYETEVAFYRDLAHTVDVSRPHCYLAALESGTANVVVVMEDLAPAEQGDQIVGCTRRAGDDWPSTRRRSSTARGGAIRR